MSALREGDEPDYGPGELRLTTELVPATSWYRNFRMVMPAAAWDQLRRQVYAVQGGRCATCRAAERLHCHEVWTYDDVAHVQRLTGFVALCALCHHVKHLGLAGILAERGA